MFAFKRSMTAFAVAASLGVAAPVFADNVSGSIYGKAVDGKTITIKNAETGLTRTVVVENGRFNFAALPTGKYTVSNGSDTYDVTVTIGTGSSVDFTSTAERIQITGSRISAIDTTSVESTTVFTQEQLEILPVDRDITDVALLAPGTVRGDTGIGNLASFGGASPAENGYFLNGFDVTNIRNFVSFADLPFDAISQQQVKTGGYGAEYGRSLGGVISLVTKRGSNDFKFGGAVYYSPQDLRAEGTDSVSRDPDLDYKTRYYAYRSANRYDDLSYNVWASGPIIEDKLFFFAMVEGQNYASNIYRSQDSYTYKNESPQALVKLDWNITDSHILELTHIENEQEGDYQFYNYPAEVRYGTRHYTENAEAPYSVKSGGSVSIANYTGYLTDDLTVTALVGRLEAFNNVRLPELPEGADCPLVYDRRETPNSSQVLGCWTATYTPDLNGKPEQDVRESIRLGFEYNIGDHTIQGGYDQEEFTSGKRGQTLTGGEYWRWHVGTGSNVNGVTVAEGDVYVRHLIIDTLSADYKVENEAWYIEDKWQMTDEWMIYMGVRAEGFTNYNGDGIAFVDSGNKIAPRFGATWDIGAEGTKKAFFTAGRYFIPVASNTNIRAAGAEIFIEEYFYADSANEDARTGAPTTVGDRIGPQNVNGSLNAPDPRTVAATNLSPMFQDEYIIGYQQEFDVWTAGVRAIYRDIKDGMDDYCSHQPFVDWAEDNGYDDFDYHTMAGCLMMNPGRDFSVALDLQNDGNYTEVTIPASYFGLEEYKRTYKAVEFFWEKPFDDGWFVQGSYTWAKSEGNAEGYVNSTLEQVDAGLTQDIDNKLFQDGAYGPLPNDRRHTFKLYGVYQLTDEVSVSANVLAQSGRAVSCTGYIPLLQYQEELGVDYGGLSSYGASSYYCNGVLGQRGDQGRTPWTYNVDMGVNYKPEYFDGKLTLKVDVRNIFNFNQITEYEEQGEIGSGTAPSPNPNFKTPVNFQSPRSVRLTARYSF